MVSKQDIKDVAFSLFAYKGYTETTTENIAKVLGLKKQSLYSHYNSKADIYQDILRDQYHIINKKLSDRIKELADKPFEILCKGVFKCIISLFSNRERLMFWKRQFLSSTKENTAIFVDEDWKFNLKLHEYLYCALCTRPERMEPESFRTFFMSYMLMIHGYLDRMLMSEQDDEASEVVWHNFWHGISYIFLQDKAVEISDQQLSKI